MQVRFVSSVAGCSTPDGVVARRWSRGWIARPVTLVLKSLLLALSLSVLCAPVLAAQFGGLGKRLTQIGGCGAGGALGYMAGKEVSRFAQRNADRLHIPKDSIAKYEKSIRIGTAAIGCLGGAALSGTVYERVSRRDMERRRDAIVAAVNEADPVTRTYVLPESQIRESVTTTAPYADGTRECKDTVVRDNAGTNEERARATFCTNGAGSGWTLEQ